jgi:hypothetical protein
MGFDQIVSLAVFVVLTLWRYPHTSSADNQSFRLN